MINILILTIDKKTFTAISWHGWHNLASNIFILKNNINITCVWYRSFSFATFLLNKNVNLVCGFIGRLKVKSIKMFLTLFGDWLIHLVMYLLF